MNIYQQNAPIADQRKRPVITTFMAYSQPHPVSGMFFRSPSVAVSCGRHTVNVDACCFWIPSERDFEDIM